jgi:hypothetical protein
MQAEPTSTENSLRVCTSRELWALRKHNMDVLGQMSGEMLGVDAIQDSPAIPARLEYS